MNHTKLILYCKRCKAPFELPVGVGLLAFCETCKRKLGRRLDAYDEWGLEERRKQIREMDPTNPRREYTK